MGQGGNQSKRKSAETDYFNQLGNLAVIQQKLEAFDGIAAEGKEALNLVGILQLFNIDRSKILPEQEMLMDKAADDILKLAVLLSAAKKNAGKIKP